MKNTPASPHTASALRTRPVLAWLVAASLVVGTAPAQPGSWSVLVIDPPAAQTGAAFGFALLGGQRTSANGDDLFVSESLWDEAMVSDVGRVHRLIWNGRQPSVAGSLVGPWAHSRMGTELEIAFSSDGDGRLLTGDPGVPANNQLNAGRVGVVRNGWTLGPNISQDTPDPIGEPEAGDDFGATLTVADFDGDGYEDVAIAAPDEDGDVGDLRGGSSEESEGVVHVYYGAAADNDLQSGQVLKPFGQQAHVYFGKALAAGDFDGDGCDDLAVGAPGAVSGIADLPGGKVYVFYGSPLGLAPGSPQILQPSDLGMTSGVGLEFGAGLAAADFNRNLLCVYYNTCRDDLVIGVPGYSSGYESRGTVGEGAIVVATGTAAGLSGSNATVIQQDDLVADLVFPPNQDDRFGERLWAGNFDGRSGADLAVGVPKDGPIDFKAGVLHLVYGGDSGLQSYPGRLLHWGNTTGMYREIDDRFGFSFTSGDFDIDGQLDLAIGVPNISSGGVPGAGRVLVLFGGCLFCDGFESGTLGAWQ